MSSEDIRSAGVDAVLNLGFSDPIVFENTEFRAPQTGDTWMQFSMFHDYPDVVTLGANGLDRFRGYFQIDINVEPGDGESVIFNRFQQFRQGIPAGTSLVFNGQTVLITSCGLSSGRRDDDFYRKSVTLFWQADVPRADVLLVKPDFVSYTIFATIDALTDEYPPSSHTGQYAFVDDGFGRPISVYSDGSEWMQIGAGSIPDVSRLALIGGDTLSFIGGEPWTLNI